jgi:branched-subunit amino acid aminotransferase/4-amino-4-deoxychorismate lyase
MLVFLNGRIVPEEQAVVSVFDRSFLYGDGLFETLRVFNCKPFRWAQHWERLWHGAEFLNITLPFPSDALRAFAAELVSRNQMPDSLLRLTLSRGIGIRGYSPAGAVNPTLVMSLHPAPGAPASGPAFGGGESAHAGPEADVPHPRLRPQWKLVTSSFRIPANEPLAQFKTCNKLPQILARAEADAAGADEALLLNTDGFVVEAASSNLFWIESDTVCTPPLASGILAGVTRAVVMEICQSLGGPAREAGVTTDDLKRRDGVFLSLSSWGVVEVQSLDGRVLRPSALVEKIQRAYLDLLRAETR